MMDRVWICRDGRQVLIRQMADSHLHNCINKILRHRTWRREFLDRLLLEVEIRKIERGGGR